MTSGKRKIPCTCATQHLDNVNKPFWSARSAVNAYDDFFDCYAAFKELDCEEYIWDWRGREADERVVTDLLLNYPKFFSENPLGKARFITLRVPEKINITDLGRVYLSVMNANKSTASKDPVLFELAAYSNEDLSKLAMLYNESVALAHDAFKTDCNPKLLSLIPVTPTSDKLLDYVQNYQTAFRQKLEFIRPVISRAQSAGRLGFVASVINTKRILSEYYVFGKEQGIGVSPIIEAGPLFFRGGLNPETVLNFLKTYQGARTVTITPSFRYDYKINDVKKAISVLNEKLPFGEPVVFSKEDTIQMEKIEKIFSKHYSVTIKELTNFLFPLSSNILSKYSCYTSDFMQSKNSNTNDDVAISSALYSLGIFPEIIGVGRALLEIIKQNQNLISDLERFYPLIKQDISEASRLLNKENLNFLAKLNAGFENIKKDVKLAEDYVETIGPRTTSDILHRNYTSNVLHLWRTNKYFKEDLLEAALIRKGIG